MLSNCVGRWQCGGRTVLHLHLDTLHPFFFRMNALKIENINNQKFSTTILFSNPFPHFFLLVAVLCRFLFIIQHHHVSLSVGTPNLAMPLSHRHHLTLTELCQLTKSTALVTIGMDINLLTSVPNIY